jgi:preprotein translocase subunit SecF
MIDWLKYKYIYFMLSAILVGTSILSLATWRLRPGIDFTGGTLVEIFSEEKVIDEKKIEKFFKESKLEVNSIRQSAKKKVVIRTKFIDQKKGARLKKDFANKFSKYKIIRFESIGPTLGRELLNKTITAAIIAVLAMLFYIAWAFKNVRFGIAAIFALLHDTLILIGSFSILGKFYGVEVDALFVTAVLTTMSFSVHDTVVVFNKIREKTKGDKGKAGSFEEVANEALTETMVRSINNSLTIAFMLLALVLLGGDTIRWFILALFIGTVLGTYSSPFVAVPLLSLFNKNK